MGHSLGARVIHYLLLSLATKKENFIKEAYLLGGAIDRTEAEEWKKASSAVSNVIFNCHSENDETLKFMYRGANALMSDPVGLGPISLCEGSKISNINCSDIICSNRFNHMTWKTKFGEILKRIG